MRDQSDKTENLSGSLLISHPGLLDPNFKKTVVLISAHSDDEGALGVVINRPIGKSLGEMKAEFAYSPLSEVPVFNGGPVSRQNLILAAWKWVEETGIFKLYFGISADKAQIMMANEPDLVVRGFLGYAGWTRGQIESEVKQDAWVVSPIDGQVLDSSMGKELWKNILLKILPEMKFLAEAPDDPSVN